jgi:signal transduction histidine kinase
MNVPGPKGETIRILEVIDTPGHDPQKPEYSIIVAGPLDWLEATVSKFRNRLSIALSLAGLGLVTVTLFQVRFGLLPLRQIENGLAAIRSGTASKLDSRLPVEIEPLQVELNALIQSNQDIVDRARTQVGNLAHALKTPLAVITNEAREEMSPFGAKVSEQARLMRDQVSHYLDRARMAASAGAIGRVTVVEATAEPLVRTLERIYRDKGVAVTMTIAQGARFQGEKQDLEEILGNLLDNACKWCRKNAFFTVSIEGPDPASKQRRMKLVVEDDGPGLTAEQRAKIGKRGMRLDESKPGSGLGLAIVSDLATSYRGAMSLDASPHGGLLVRVDLPAV